jgi:predicted CxxxxCH...CXXCH cytochrome family protein
MADAGRLSLGGALFLAAVAALVPSGCLKPRDQPQTDADVARCTTCHGDPDRSGDSLSRSAPPYDLLHQTKPGYPGVGAHSIHLNAASTHGAIACDECHVVPESVDSPGHADTDRPAELVFGELAKKEARDPSYDPERRTCVDTYCHRDARPVWSEPKSSAETCGSCHGLPPAAPHPQSDRCSACHGDVIDAERQFIAPERHADGNVDFTAGECQQCHGGPSNAAPPVDTLGNQEITAIGVGAHQAHLSGGASGRPLGCDECHRVPERVEEPTHVDGLPAEVTLTGIASSMGHTASFDPASATCSAFCHSPSPGSEQASPVWNAETTLTCTSCHGAPPPAPHPQMTTCSTCHAAVVGPDDHTIVDKSRHVNGLVDVAVDRSCRSCHGGDNDAPPRDVEGNTNTTAPGVGAHQTHVQGTASSRAVPCDVCHVVPKDVLVPGHVDTDRPAEVTFSGIATINGAKPAYANGTCNATPCHGAAFPDERESGGSHTAPDWTKVDGTEAACGTCHGLPPPPPHPLNTYPCHQCHGNLADDDRTFLEPERHVDGIVTLTLE